MHMQTYRATLLSPLTYRTRPDSGAGGASVTGRFLGDLALDYAIEHVMTGGDHLWDGRTKTKPDYKNDISKFNWRCTVGVPTRAVSMLPIEYQATSFMSEGYVNMRAWKQTGSSSMKNWMQRQSVAPFNDFMFLAISKAEKLPEKFTVRMGNGRETLVSLVSIGVPELVTVNAFTISALLDRNVPKGQSVQMENSKYILIHGVTPEKAVEALGWP